MAITIKQTKVVLNNVLKKEKKIKLVTLFFGILSLSLFSAGVGTIIGEKSIDFINCLFVFSSFLIFFVFSHYNNRLRTLTIVRMKLEHQLKHLRSNNNKRKIKD